MFHQCAQPEFRAYAAQVLVNAVALAHGLLERGCVLTTGGTDNHLMVIDLRPFGVRGRAVQAAFDEVGITLNANAFPGHGGTAYNPNGIRLGTPAVTSRGCVRRRWTRSRADPPHAQPVSRTQGCGPKSAAGAWSSAARFPLPYRRP